MTSSRVAFLVISSLSFGVAGYALVVYATLPPGATVHPEMRRTFDSQRLGIYAHVLGSALTLLLGPWQFLPSLRRSRSRVHRMLGRVYLLAGVGIGGIAGLYMSFFAFGGAVSTAGFALLATIWLYTGYRAYAAATNRRFDEHRRWMIRNFALALAAVTLRLYLGVGFALRLPFEIFYPTLAWISWVPNLIAAEILVRPRSDRHLTH